MSQEKQPQGCGCLQIPISVILILLGSSSWLLYKFGIPDFNLLVSKVKREDGIPTLTPTPNSSDTSPNVEKSQLPNAPIVTSPKTNSSVDNLPTSPIVSTKSQANKNTVTSAQKTPETNKTKTVTSEIQNSPISGKPQTFDKNKPQQILATNFANWHNKKIRGIYFSRYQITNNTSEQVIRERVRYYKSQGINTIIHGVWGNACTMYNSQIMQQYLGFKSCPNLFQDKWLDWLIDEAHQQGMEVHAYFEKGIKIDKNSPIFDLAVAKKWLVPGVDRTYTGVDHYVLDVENPEIASFFRDILVEFVQKYPQIDAVQWDDYLGYHAELPGKVDRTASLTKFVREMITAMKEANPNVSFDLCHHNPYWAKRYFAADWKQWGVDRVFIQAYNEKGFKEELNYAQKHDGVAITDRQFHRLPKLLENSSIESILVFPLSGKPEATASQLKSLIENDKN